MFDELEPPKKDNSLKISLLDISKWAGVAQEKWIRENTPEQIEKRVYEILDKRTEEVVAKLLGFSPRWGEWEIDHCNGRAGQSEAGNYLACAAKGAVVTWLEQQADSINNLKLPPTALKAIKKEALINARREFRSELEALVMVKMKEYAEEVIDEFTQDAPMDVMNAIMAARVVKDENS